MQLLMCSYGRLNGKFYHENNENKGNNSYTKQAASHLLCITHIHSVLTGQRNTFKHLPGNLFLWFAVYFWGFSSILSVNVAERSSAYHSINSDYCLLILQQMNIKTGGEICVWL